MKPAPQVANWRQSPAARGKRHRGSRARNASLGSILTPSRATSRWLRFERPLRALVWLLIALTTLAIYREAEYVLTRVFGVALLFAFAAIIALLLTPLIDLLERRQPFRGRRALAVILLYAVVLAAVAGFILLITPSLVAEGRQLPQLSRRVQETFTQVQNTLAQRGVPVHFSFPDTTPVLGATITIFATTVSALVNVLIVVVISIYLSVQGRKIIAMVRGVFPEHSGLFDFTLTAIATTLGAYARGQLLMSLLMGIYTGAVMSLIGVHYAFVLGIAAFFLEFLPLIGAPVAMVLATAVALFQSTQMALFAGVAGIGGHAIEAYIIGPRLTGHVTRLHPLAAMAALLIGADLGGILGALFAVPVAALANVFLGALYRSRRGGHALTTSADGTVTAEGLPRLGEEITEVDESAQVERESPE